MLSADKATDLPTKKYEVASVEITALATLKFFGTLRGL